MECQPTQTPSSQLQREILDRMSNVATKDDVIRGPRGRSSRTVTRTLRASCRRSIPYCPLTSKRKGLRASEPRSTTSRPRLTCMGSAECKTAFDSLHHSALVEQKAVREAAHRHDQQVAGLSLDTNHSSELKALQASLCKIGESSSQANGHRLEARHTHRHSLGDQGETSAP